MTEQTLDTLGPVEFLVFEFPAATSNFTGEGEKELLKLVDAGLVRVIDILVLIKSLDGSIETMELSEMEDLGDLLKVEARLAETLAAEDLAQLSAAMAPGSTAAVLVYESIWAAPFAAAMRRAGGELIANGRIPRQAIVAAVQASEAAAAAEAAGD